MSKPLLLWDFDGVMADSTDFVFTYWQQAFNQAGIDFGLEDYQATFTYKFPFDYLREHFDQNLVEQIYHDYSAHEEKLYPQSVPAFAGFIKGFEQIADQHEHHLVSSNLQSVIKPWLGNHNLETSFRSVLGRETPGYKDAKITTLLQQHQIPASEVIFVGDTVSDIEHGHQAGVQTVAVTWGVHGREMLEPTKPHHLCDTMDELFTLLRT